MLGNAQTAGKESKRLTNLSALAMCRIAGGKKVTVQVVDYLQ